MDASGLLSLVEGGSPKEIVEEEKAEVEMSQVGNRGPSQGKYVAPADSANGQVDVDEAGMTPTSRQIDQDMRFTLLETDAEDEEADERVAADEDPLEGLDQAAVEGVASAMQFAMELPFTLARHISIPAANWNGKRRLLAALCPACGFQVAMLSFG